MDDKVSLLVGESSRQRRLRLFERNLQGKFPNFKVQLLKIRRVIGGDEAGQVRNSKLQLHSALGLTIYLLHGLMKNEWEDDCMSRGVGLGRDLRHFQELEPLSVIPSVSTSCNYFIKQFISDVNSAPRNYEIWYKISFETCFDSCRKRG